MSVKEKNSSFENFSDWLKHGPNHHNSSKELSKNEKQKNIMSDQKNSTHVGKKAISEFNKKEQKPQIVLKETNGVVTGLEITCVCGEIITVNFEYDKQVGISYLKKNS